MPENKVLLDDDVPVGRNHKLATAVIQQGLIDLMAAGALGWFQSNSTEPGSLNFWCRILGKRASDVRVFAGQLLKGNVCPEILPGKMLNDYLPIWAKFSPAVVPWDPSLVGKWVATNRLSTVLSVGQTPTAAYNRAKARSRMKGSNGIGLSQISLVLDPNLVKTSSA